MNYLEKEIYTAASLLGEYLHVHSMTITTAESCTGGGLSQAITDIPGSSAWFEYGFITYANRAKSDLLGVKKSDIDKYGAVSEAVAQAMALGAIQRAQADIALSISGIAGPDGGSEDKPVGTVCFGWALPQGKVVTLRQFFNGDRRTVRQQSVLFALTHLLDLLTPQEIF